MPSHLVDTNVLIDVLRRKNGKREHLYQLVAGGATLACSVITIAELYAGVRNELPATERLMEQFDVYDLTPGIARLGGSLRAEWARRGRTLSLADTLIAATAINHNLELLTANVKDYPMLFPPEA